MVSLIALMDDMDFKLGDLKVQLDQFSTIVDSRYFCFERIIKILNDSGKYHAQKILMLEMKVSKLQ